MGVLGTYLSPMISCMMILCMHENSLSFGLEVEDIRPLRGIYSGLGRIRHGHNLSLGDDKGSGQRVNLSLGDSEGVGQRVGHR